MIALARHFTPIAATAAAQYGGIPCCLPHECVVPFVVTDVFAVKYERDCEVDDSLAVRASDGDRRLERRDARDRDR